MKLLRVIATVDPRHGGPSAGLRAVTPALRALGHETTIVSLDGPERGARFWPDGEIHALGPAQGGYAYAPALRRWLRAHAREFDAVFVHGLWQHHGRVVRAELQRGGPPYFVFPHGMLDPWFRRAHPLKHAKKWLYWQLCERHVLHGAAAVIFTCDEERRLARETFPNSRYTERVVAYGTAAPKIAAASLADATATLQRRLDGRPFLLFLGRLHPKKGLDLLVDAYRTLATDGGETLPVLAIAGPTQDRPFVEALQRRAQQIQSPGKIVWLGMLEGAAKWAALRSAEAFVLPSHQENFGLAAAEALAAGAPVLLTDKVNIWSEIVDSGAGLVERDDLIGITQLLRRWHRTPPTTRAAMRTAAARLFAERYEIGRVARSLVATITPFLRSPAVGLSHDPVSAHPRRFSRSLR